MKHDVHREAEAGDTMVFFNLIKLLWYLHDIFLALCCFVVWVCFFKHQIRET